MKIIMRFLVVLFSVFPLVWAIVTSLKQGSELYKPKIGIDHPTFNNYYSIFLEQPFGKNIINSIIVATSTVILTICFSIIAAYPLSRKKFIGRKLILYSYLFSSMFPQIAILAGMFELIRLLGFYNHLIGLILSYMVFSLPFGVWSLTSFMKSVPKEIEDAALLDGANSLEIIFKVFLPIMKPSILATSLLVFVAAWNEFLFALTFTISETSRTVPVAIAFMSGSSVHELPWGNIMAASVVVTFPLVLMVIGLQKYFISGLTSGAVRG